MNVGAALEAAEARQAEWGWSGGGVGVDDWPEVVLDREARVDPAKLSDLLSSDFMIEGAWRGERPDLGGDQSAIDLSLASSALHAGWSFQKVADLIIQGRRYRKADVDKAALRPDYVPRTLARAAPSGPKSRPEASGASGAAERPGAESGSSEGPRFAPSDELLAKVPREPDWVWEGVLARKAKTLIAGKPKAGKSTLVYELVRAVADGGGELLGRGVEPGAVVYASEEGHATLGSTFPRRPDIHLTTRETAWPKPTWRELVAAAVVAVRETGAGLCVLDTFTFWNGLTGEQERIEGYVKPLIDALDEITRSGCAVLLVHHQRKGGGGEDGDAIRGSNALLGEVDAFVEVERIADAPTTHRQIVVTSRWPTRSGVLVGELVEGLGYRLVGEVADRREAAGSSWPERILEALPDGGEGISNKDLEALLGADKRKWSKALQGLVREGRVERSGRGVAFDPHLYRRVSAGAAR